MKKTVEVRICTGTACYVQGGSYLLDLENQFESRDRDLLDIRGVGCLGLCGGDGELRPPFASIDGEIIGGAELHELVETVRSKLRGVEG